MKMTNAQYASYVKSLSPPSPMGKNLLLAFTVGGLICCLGQAIGDGLTALGANETQSAAGISVLLVFLSALLTGLGVYDDIAHFAGAGTLVPITGFANSIAAPALEFKAEGFVTGLAAKMFVIAGPVLVYGTLASVLYGLVLVCFPSLL